jgi:hypothetical protein
MKAGFVPNVDDEIRFGRIRLQGKSISVRIEKLLLEISVGILLLSEWQRLAYRTHFSVHCNFSFPH